MDERENAVNSKKVLLVDNTIFQDSCLENPRDGGAWRAAVYGVAQSQTRLKRLSSSSNTILKKEPQGVPP